MLSVLRVETNNRKILFKEEKMWNVRICESIFASFLSKISLLFLTHQTNVSKYNNDEAETKAYLWNENKGNFRVVFVDGGVLNKFKYKIVCQCW